VRVGSNDRKRASAALTALRTKRRLKLVPAGGGMMEALLLALVAQGSSLAAAERALAKIKASVVNWNELRVTQAKEVAALLAGVREAPGKAAAIHDVLSSIFEETHDLEFGFLEGASTAEAKDFLSGLGALTDEMVDEFVLAGRGHFHISADGDVVRVLRRLGVAARSDSPVKFEAALSELVSAEKAYQLMYLAKRLAEGICTAHGPKCPECPVVLTCPSAKKSKDG